MALDLVNKYDRIAAGFAERSYANLHFYMQRRFGVATTWGKALCAGDSVLELGCGDGYLARIFAGHGLRYCGVDMSPRMIAMAEQRLLQYGLEAEFRVSDARQLFLTKPFDAVVSYMRTFFTYVDNPLAVMMRLRPYIRKKMILDFDPRHTPVSAAVEILREAGFVNVAWRPFFVPEEKKLPPAILRTLVACENVPFFRSLPLRWKFLVLVKGETC
jgi:2-polyprenyl-3-methyl-5-hydroxy-6-metoxy-1,4-benzoquinol methylase